MMNGAGKPYCRGQPLSSNVSHRLQHRADSMSLKDRFAKALRKKAERGFAGYPLATIAFYGPDDKVATKVAVGIAAGKKEDPMVLERWFNQRSDVRRDPLVNEQILKFIRAHGVKSVVMTERIIGCPHEEGVDYPERAVCPQCPFWANRDRWTGELLKE